MYQRLVFVALLLTFCIVGKSQDSIFFKSNSIEKHLQVVDLTNSFDLSNQFGKHLQHLCAHPHPAGTVANDSVRMYIAKAMKESGLSVQEYPYDVYISAKPGESLVEIVEPKRSVLNQKENIIKGDSYSGHSALTKGWTAWSGSGDVTAEVVYANYARKEDFEFLLKNDIDLNGKIIIARYGGNFRGFKAKYAEMYGAAGLIIYTDPKDSGYYKGLVYPDGPYFNGTAVQRGSLLTLDYVGDPLTPGKPALPIDGDENIERLNPDHLPFHNIPVTVLGYDAAEEILSQMEGAAVPQSWQGGCPFTYRLSGGPDLKVRVMVDQQKDMRRITNVVGQIKGNTYPEEWIIIGSHYDAWTFGAADPNSGTALCLAVGNIYGQLKGSGHRPERSILIAHWDAEEHGIIGSTEWVEQFQDELKGKVVAYINLDAAVTGRYFSAASAPTLKSVVTDAAKYVSFPDSSKTLYDVWNKGRQASSEPPIRSLGGGSDHLPFYAFCGIPSTAVSSSNTYLYHTAYDNLTFYERFLDSTYVMGDMMAKYITILISSLANADIIPYDIERYVTDLYHHFDKAKEQLTKKGVDEALIDPVFEMLAVLDESINSFKKNLSKEHKVSSLSDQQIKQLNKQFLSLEQSFIYDPGMPFGEWFKSLYAASDPFSGYASWILPPLQYIISTGELDKVPFWIEQYLAVLNQLNGKIEYMNTTITGSR